MVRDLVPNNSDPVVDRCSFIQLAGPKRAEQLTPVEAAGHDGNGRLSPWWPAPRRTPSQLSDGRSALAAAHWLAPQQCRQRSLHTWPSLRRSETAGPLIGCVGAVGARRSCLGVAAPSPTRLDAILKLSEVEKLDAGGICDVWRGFHTRLDASAAVCLTEQEWKTIEPRLRSAPTFAYPLLRSPEQGAEHEGAFVTVFSQFQGPQHVLVTTLPDIQQFGQSSAKPHVIVTVYPELARSKGIVLARVDIVSPALLDKGSAEELVKDLAEMYLLDDRFLHVAAFNEKPETFSFDAVLDIARAGSASSEGPPEEKHS